ncbi:MAG: integration host factor subunit alpha [Desulfobacterales bacterium]|uniref:Integration host factor subunit alpha n=1 Tax=Candidatus Desulfatibia profunda TaxID=2841695 RepID=A0A8J6NSY5_9BACT|nr:integration host factor subunit alpha [Candidatus Desulfatibia profunda]MBL7180928.1 integration host factor subunit alpha [Desulfobacterales bacterium]
MALTKAKIVEEIGKNSGLDNKQSGKAVETLLGIMKDTLASGEDVMISRFGKFCLKDKKQRKGRNPATGDDMMLKPRRIVIFKCSGKLRRKINGE